MKKIHFRYYCGAKSGNAIFAKYIQIVTCKKCRLNYHKYEAKKLFG